MRHLAMLRKRFPFLVRQSLTTLALTATLIATAWAQPKFKILATVPGGLFSGLTFDVKGNLYGGTGGGGEHNDGTIFELTPGAHGWTLTTIHSFDGYDGGSPNGGLIFGAAGNLYGTSPSGGTYDGGNVFELAPGVDSWTFNDLYDFCPQYHCPGGSAPKAGVVIGNGGSLFGTTASGGSVDEGVVFKLAPGSGKWNESVLYNFDGRKGGIQPYAPLIFDAEGNLYGTTAGTNVYQEGTVFELVQHLDWKERKLWQFDGADGAGPSHGVVFDASANLYGTAGGGKDACSGFLCGVVFSLTQTQNGRWKETVIHNFSNEADGWLPSSGVVLDKAGNLYGTTGVGGIGDCPDGCGVVYRLAPAANGKWQYTVLHRFTGSDGGEPGGGLIFDKKGNLYGTAYNVVYEITP
jgi:uncharacterized repeat protein (TIGR03803 family)